MVGCSSCATPLRLRLASPARQFSSSPQLLRPPRESRSRPAASFFSRPPPPLAYKRQRQSSPFAPWESKSRPAPSAVTRESVLRKLQQHLLSQWSRHDNSIRALGVDLGADPARFRTLSVAFAQQALRDLENGRQGASIWDLDDLRAAYVTSGDESLKQHAFAAFVRWAASQSLPVPTARVLVPDPTLSKLHHLARLTDLRFPGDYYPLARQMRRKIILHVGPTNSGKTHSALVALARARTGAYAGPLRLLAHEVFSRFNEGKIGDEGKRACNLVTGEEKRIVDEFAGLSSCTVEMFPVGKCLDVGVIDEIQMIGDSQRGTAWTNAVIGAQCKVLHLCGEASVVDLVRNITRDLGDECIVKKYERLSPLEIAKESLGSDLSKIRRGDCLVTFSRNNIFAFKRMVEEKTGLRVAVAYGGLPPEVREEQARAFNEERYDVLVASDAVGMGLNLFVPLSFPPFFLGTGR